MKKVLSLLVAFVFMQVQTWALSGGPQYGGNQAAVSGTYAGVFTGIGGTAVAQGGAALVDPTGTNALGLFVIGVPKTDLATGSFALFFEGVFFQGGILAIADPNKSTLNGVAQAVHIIQLSSGGSNSLSVNFDATADGTIKTKIGTAGLGGISLVGKGLFTVSQIVTSLQIIPDPNNPGKFLTFTVQTSVPSGTLSFTVDGFKQSVTVVKPAAGSIANLFNGQGGNTGG